MAMSLTLPDVLQGIYALEDAMRDYERQYGQVLSSTLLLAQRGRQLAELAGEVTLPEGYRNRFYPRSSAIAWLPRGQASLVPRHHF